MASRIRWPLFPPSGPSFHPNKYPNPLSGYKMAWAKPSWRVVSCNAFALASNASRHHPDPLIGRFQNERPVRRCSQAHAPSVGHRVGVNTRASSLPSNSDDPQSWSILHLSTGADHQGHKDKGWEQPNPGTGVLVRSPMLGATAGLDSRKSRAKSTDYRWQLLSVPRLIDATRRFSRPHMVWTASHLACPSPRLPTLPK